MGGTANYSSQGRTWKEGGRRHYLVYVPPEKGPPRPPAIHISSLSSPLELDKEIITSATNSSGATPRARRHINFIFLLPLNEKKNLSLMAHTYVQRVKRRELAGTCLASCSVAVDHNIILHDSSVWNTGIAASHIINMARSQEEKRDGTRWRTLDFKGTCRSFKPHPAARSQQMAIHLEVSSERHRVQVRPRLNCLSVGIVYSGHADLYVPKQLVYTSPLHCTPQDNPEALT